MNDREFQDRLLPRLLEVDAGPPDPNLVAAYVAGTLPPDQERQVARQVAVDPESMLLVRALRADRRRIVATRLLVGVAALVMAVFGVRAAFRGPLPTPASFSDRLTAECARLAKEDPELFDGLVPYSSAELTTEGVVLRGGGTITWPVGVLLEAPAELRWRGPDGATLVRVSIEGPGTSFTRDVEGSRLAAPPLAAGRYAMRLRALDALAGQEVRGAFVIAAPDVVRRHARAFEAIRASGARGVSEIVRAHYALRHGLLAEARRAADAASAAFASSSRPATDAEGSGSAADVTAAADAIRRHVATIAPDAP